MSGFQRSLICCFVAPVLAGCAQQLRVCPGKGSAEEALSALNRRAERAVAFRASGQCLLEYRDESSGKSKQNVAVQIWVEPPCRMYVQGSVAVDPRGVVIGANEEEFWLIIRPKEISSYYWGRWDEAGYVEDLAVNPRIVLEGLGIPTTERQADGASWTLSSEGSYDVLTCRSEGGPILKRIYIYNCDYSVRRIEYCDENGDLAATAQLSQYEQIAEGFCVPRRIEISKHGSAGAADSIKIRLISAKAAQFSDKVRTRIFNRPAPSGFEHVFKVVEGSAVEQ